MTFEHVGRPDGNRVILGHVKPKKNIQQRLRRLNPARTAMDTFVIVKAGPRLQNTFSPVQVALSHWVPVNQADFRTIRTNEILSASKISDSFVKQPNLLPPLVPAYPPKHKGVFRHPIEK